MKELKFEGKVKSTKKTLTQTDDIDKEEGTILIETKEGEKVIIKGDYSILDGFKPKQEIIVTFNRAQKTLEESTK